MIVIPLTEQIQTIAVLLGLFSCELLILTTIFSHYRYTTNE